MKQSKDILEAAKDLLKKAKTESYQEISPGAWLSSSEDLIAEQKDQEAETDDHDFTTAPFWITTDDGKAIPIQDAQDLSEYSEGY